MAPRKKTKVEMASQLEKKAMKESIEENYQFAVDLYSEAIRMNPDSANLYAGRAQAHMRLENFSEALADAEKTTSMAKDALEEQLYQQIKAMRDNHLLRVEELHEEACGKLKQPQQKGKLEFAKQYLEGVISLLSLEKGAIPLSWSSKLIIFEMNICKFIYGDLEEYGLW